MNIVYLIKQRVNTSVQAEGIISSIQHFASHSKGVLLMLFFILEFVKLFWFYLLSKTRAINVIIYIGHLLVVGYQFVRML
jgi:hypothetical protein